MMSNVIRIGVLEFSLCPPQYHVDFKIIIEFEMIIIRF